MKFEARFSDILTKWDQRGMAVTVSFSFVAADEAQLKAMLELFKLYGQTVEVTIRKETR